ncbi:hypothetical protein ACXX9E_29280 [Pseudomonas sp. GNP014]
MSLPLEIGFLETKIRKRAITNHPTATATLLLYRNNNTREAGVYYQCGYWKDDKYDS